MILLIAMGGKSRVREFLTTLFDLVLDILKNN